MIPINAGVHARERNGRVTQRCHNSPDGKRGYRVRVTSRTGSVRRILKKLFELSPASGEDCWLSLARGGLATGVHEMGGGGGADGKARIERMCIALLMSKNL